VSVRSSPDTRAARQQDAIRDDGRTTRPGGPVDAAHRMTTDQRAFLVRSLKRVGLALVLGGLVFGLYAGNEVREPSPAEQLRFLEDWERTGALSTSDVQDLAALRIRRDAGQLSTWRPIDVGAVIGFSMFGGPIILLGGVVWWIARFLQAG
jgi:hypothetical protein